VLSMAQEGCEGAKAELITAKEIKEKAIASRHLLIKEKEDFEAVHRSFMELLEDDTCAGESRTQKLEEVRQGLQAIPAAEASLITATIAALTQLRGSRSKFEEVSAKAVGRTFTEQFAKLEQGLVRNTEEQEDGPIETAEILHDAMIQNAASKELVLTNNREALEKAESALKAAKKETKQQVQVRTVCQAERDALLNKTAELAEVVECVKRLSVSIDPPSPGPAARGAAAAALMEDEPEDDTQAAVSLGDALITDAEDADASQGTSVEPANLEAAFDDAGVETAIEEQATKELVDLLLDGEPVEDDEDLEPPAKRLKLDGDVEVEEESAEIDATLAGEAHLPADEPMASADEVVVPAGTPPRDSPVKEIVREPSPEDLQTQMMTGGA